MWPYTYNVSGLKSIDVRDMYIFDIMPIKVMFRCQKSPLFISPQGKKSHKLWEKLKCCRLLCMYASGLLCTSSANDITNKPRIYPLWSDDKKSVHAPPELYSLQSSVLLSKPVVQIKKNTPVTFFSVTQQPKSGLKSLVFEVPRLHTIRHTQSIGLRWTSNHLVA